MVPLLTLVLAASLTTATSYALAGAEFLGGRKVLSEDCTVFDQQAFIDAANNPDCGTVTVPSETTLDITVPLVFTGLSNKQFVSCSSYAFRVKNAHFTVDLGRSHQLL